MSELDKLEAYLKAKGIRYQRFDVHEEWQEKDITFIMDRHQIMVPDEENSEWDVICQKGSYGYEEGLLEAYGSIVPEDYDVLGWLTAAEVIELIAAEENERRYNPYNR